jgi:hypothetical protein
MNGTTLFRSLAMTCVLGTALAASEVPPQLKAARAEYQRATAAGPSEAARVRYLTKIADLRYADMAQRHDGQPLLQDEEWQALDREAARHPMPGKSDARELSKLLAGKWASPRHDYLYRANGTWTMLPETLDGVKSTHGTWKVSGNTVVETVGNQPERSTSTILLLTRKYYVVAEDGTTFYRMRP